MMAETVQFLTKADFIFGLSVMYDEMCKAFVQKDGAKVLSTNDFTTELKEKLEGITEANITEDEIKALFNKGSDGE